MVGDKKQGQESRQKDTDMKVSQQRTLTPGRGNQKRQKMGKKRRKKTTVNKKQNRKQNKAEETSTVVNIRLQEEKYPSQSFISYARKGVIFFLYLTYSIVADGPQVQGYQSHSMIVQRCHQACGH